MGDFQFIWSNVLGTEFCIQPFTSQGLDPSKHNVFTFLSKQVNEENICKFNNGDIILMNCYHVHRSQENQIQTKGKEERKIFRQFMRLSCTHTPITSIKMTINPDIEYNYPFHCTLGNIPLHLIEK